MPIDPADRVIHTLHADGRPAVTLKVPSGGFIGYHWDPSGAVTFGHGVTREEALLEVALKVRRRMTRSEP